MNLINKRTQLEQTIKRLTNSLEDAKKEYELIKDCVQIKTTDLYNGIEKYITTTKREGIYQYILGGDGRSSPWSENRIGVIATIKINKGFYLNDEQKNVVKEYVKEKYKPDHIEVF